MTTPPRPHCLPGCDRLDGHDGRDEGACMHAGVVLSQHLRYGCERLDEHEPGPDSCGSAGAPYARPAVHHTTRPLRMPQAANWHNLGACWRQPPYGEALGGPCGVCRHAWYMHLGFEFCAGCRVDIMDRELMTTMVEVPGIHVQAPAARARPAAHPAMAAAGDPGAPLPLIIEIPSMQGVDLRKLLEGIIAALDQAPLPGPGSEWLTIRVRDHEITMRVVLCS